PSLTPHPTPFPYTTLFRSRMAGVAYTDWSWSALFADFDNDGRKDIFVSSGYPKAVNDFDYDMAVYRANRRGDTATEMKELRELRDRKSTRLNSSHEWKAYA